MGARVLLKVIEDEPVSGQERKAAFEKAYLVYCLYLSRGNLTSTATYSGFTVKTIYNWLDKYPDVKEALIDYRDYKKPEKLRAMVEPYLIREDVLRNIKVKKLMESHVYQFASNEERKKLIKDVELAVV